MIVVLADDLTGAAEIGGAAWRYGLTVEIHTGLWEAAGQAEAQDGEAQAEFQPAAGVDLLVIDTDTRALSPQAAAQRVAGVAQAGRRAGATRFFKKVDSVLRGPVLAEVYALAQALGLPRVILAPANPGLGRTIRQGVYSVGEQPLDQTDFVNDPTYPALTANVRDLLVQRSGAGLPASWPVQALPPGAPLPPAGLIIGDAARSADVTQWAHELDEDTLPVGAGEFFAAFLAANGYSPTRADDPRPAGGDGRLFVCGSTSSATRQFCRRCEAAGTPVLRIPVELMEAAAGSAPPPGRSERQVWIAKWARAGVDALYTHNQAVIAIDRPVSDVPGRPELLSEHLGAAVERILAAAPVAHLFVEGGATAVALVRRLGWQRLGVVQELRPGVVCLQVVGEAGPLLTMKPGSYIWPDEVIL